MLIMWGALLAGSLVVAYVMARALHHLVYVGFSGEKEAVKKLVLYPLAIVLVGSVVALLGVVMMFLADGALARRRAPSRNGAPDSLGPR